ncbi:hypothetical protein ONZ45_g18035 [Pleurotus djamor]|nr:hypothetical protein ONZ45_g18035 [Pleurotus djamor]
MEVVQGHHILSRLSGLEHEFPSSLLTLLIVPRVLSERYTLSSLSSPGFLDDPRLCQLVVGSILILGFAASALLEFDDTNADDNRTSIPSSYIPPQTISHHSSLLSSLFAGSFATPSRPPSFLRDRHYCQLGVGPIVVLCTVTAPVIIIPLDFASVRLVEVSHRRFLRS